MLKYNNIKKISIFLALGFFLQIILYNVVFAYDVEYGKIVPNIERIGKKEFDLKLISTNTDENNPNYKLVPDYNINTSFEGLIDSRNKLENRIDGIKTSSTNDWDTLYNHQYFTNSLIPTQGLNIETEEKNYVFSKKVVSLLDTQMVRFNDQLGNSGNITTDGNFGINFEDTKGKNIELKNGGKFYVNGQLVNNDFSGFNTKAYIDGKSLFNSRLKISYDKNDKSREYLWGKPIYKNYVINNGPGSLYPLVLEHTLQKHTNEGTMWNIGTNNFYMKHINGNGNDSNYWEIKSNSDGVFSCGYIPFSFKTGAMIVDFDLSGSNNGSFVGLRNLKHDRRIEIEKNGSTLRLVSTGSGNPFSGTKNGPSASNKKRLLINSYIKGNSNYMDVVLYTNGDVNGYQHHTLIENKKINPDEWEFNFCQNGKSNDKTLKLHNVIYYPTDTPFKKGIPGYSLYLYETGLGLYGEENYLQIINKRKEKQKAGLNSGKVVLGNRGFTYIDKPLANGNFSFSNLNKQAGNPFKSSTLPKKIGMVAEAYLYVPNNTSYNFGVAGYDNLELFIDGKSIIKRFDVNGKVGDQEYVYSDKVILRKGFHKIKLIQERDQTLNNKNNNWYVVWKEGNGKYKAINRNDIYYSIWNNNGLDYTEISPYGKVLEKNVGFNVTNYGLKIKLTGKAPTKNLVGISGIKNYGLLNMGFNDDNEKKDFLLNLINNHKVDIYNNDLINGVNAFNSKFWLRNNKLNYIKLISNLDNTGFTRNLYSVNKDVQPNVDPNIRISTINNKINSSYKFKKTGVYTLKGGYLTKKMQDDLGIRLRSNGIQYQTVLKAKQKGFLFSKDFDKLNDKIYLFQNNIVPNGDFDFRIDYKKNYVFSLDNKNNERNHESTFRVFGKKDGFITDARNNIPMNFMVKETDLATNMKLKENFFGKTYIKDKQKNNNDDEHIFSLYLGKDNNNSYSNNQFPELGISEKYLNYLKIYGFTGLEENANGDGDNGVVIPLDNRFGENFIERDCYPEDGLIHYYDFENGSFNDKIGNNNLKPGNGVDIVENGKFGSGARIKQKNQYMELTNGLALPNITIAFWYKFAGTGESRWNTLIGRKGWSQHHLLVHPTNHQIGYHNNSWYSLGKTLDVVPGGKWYYIAYSIKNGNKFILSVNGNEIYEERTSGVFNPQSFPVKLLGSANAVDQGSLGIWDDIRIWNKSMEGDELRNLYNYGLEGKNGEKCKLRTKNTLSSVIPKGVNSDNYKGYVFSSKDIYNSSYPAWKAFDNNHLTSYHSQVGTNGNWNGGWLQVKLPSKKIVKMFTLKAIHYFTYGKQFVNNFKFEGSNDGNNWKVLGEYTNQQEVLNSIGEVLEYTVDNTEEFQYYRINVTDVIPNGGNKNFGIAEFNLFENTVNDLGESLIPNLTKYNDKGWTVSALNEQSNKEIWKAFDNSQNTGWWNNRVIPNEIKIERTNNDKIMYVTAYSILPEYGNSINGVYSPKDFELLGLTKDGEWEIIDRQRNIVFRGFERKYFYIKYPNFDGYLKLKLKITRNGQNSTNGNYIAISDFKVYGSIDDYNEPVSMIPEIKSTNYQGFNITESDYYHNNNTRRGYQAFDSKIINSVYHSHRNPGHGAYIEIRTPYKIKLSKIGVIDRYIDPNGQFGMFPKELKVYGANKNNVNGTLKLIGTSVKGDGYPGTNMKVDFEFNDNDGYYDYFKIVFNQVSASSLSSAQNHVAIGKMNLYGFKENN